MQSYYWEIQGCITIGDLKDHRQGIKPCHELCSAYRRPATRSQPNGVPGAAPDVMRTVSAS